MAAISKTDLCNIALLKISGAVTDTGALFISSITGSTKTELAFAKVYPFARREALARADWDFASMYLDLGTELSGVNLVEAADWEYQFALPDPEGVDYPFVRLIHQTDETDHTKTYDCEVLPNADDDAFILATNNYTNADGDSAFIKYIWDNDDPNMYSPLFIEAFTTLLASKVAPFVKTAKEAVRLKQIYEQMDLSNASGYEQRREYKPEHETWFDKRTA